MESSFVRDLVGYMAIFVELFGLCFNFLAVYLIKKQGFGTIDKWLSLVIALNDIALISFKFGQWIVFQTTGQGDVYSNKKLAGFDYFLTSFSLSSSILCVGILAVLRWWGIAKARRVVFKNWAFAYIIPQSFLLIFIILVIVKKEYTLMPFERYHFVNGESKHIIPLFTNGLIILWILFSIIAMNTCYIIITKTYLKHYQLSPNFVGYDSRELAQERCRKRIYLTIKMSVVLVVYDIILLSPLVVVALEFINHKMRSYLGDSIFGISLMALTLINPITLIFLHQETFYDLKFLMQSIFSSHSSRKMTILHSTSNSRI